ncbi:MAG: MBL fold metallo-hydrolase [Rhodospirillaceae bacterium]|nr:MBL fold metallo-hydrolase [Rhodospirillaceae bacterium]
MSRMLTRSIMIMLIAAFAALPAIAQDAKRSIKKVAGDVYRSQNNFHFSLIVVTSDGVVVVDPINAGASGWLKANLKQVTAKPITHLIYSHSHGDHASGGAVLGAKTVIAHANAPDAIDGVKPTMRFTDTKTLKIGDKTLELTYLGKGHGEDLIAVVVRPENVGFIVDAASPKRLPFRDMPHADVDGWINQIRKIEQLDFKIFAPGHGSIGVKKDATDARIYMEKLRAQVLAGLKAGKNADDLAASVTMDAYKDWQAYGTWRELNVRGMARFLAESGQVK